MPLQLQRSSGATAWATLLMDGHNRALDLQKPSEGETCTILWKTLLPGNNYLTFSIPMRRYVKFVLPYAPEQAVSCNGGMVREMLL